jgi:hypothetical protein
MQLLSVSLCTGLDTFNLGDCLLSISTPVIPLSLPSTCYFCLGLHM